MRALLLAVAAFSLCLLQGCSEQAAPPASSAKIVPIAPLLDWSSVAGRNARDKDGAGNPAAGSKGTKPSPHRSSSSETAERDALFARLPKDALIVVELPDLSALGDTLDASQLGRLLDSPQVGAQLAPLRVGFAFELARLRSQSPELGAALELLPKLGGKVAVALSGLTPESLGELSTSQTWTLTAIYDAGSQADRVAEASAPLFAALAKQRKWSLTEKAEPAWGCETGDAQLMLDFERKGDTFELRLGGRNAVMRELALSRKRTDATSYLATRVAADAADVAPLGAKPVLAVQVQLTSLWDSMRASGNRADLRVLARTGLTQLHGASLAVGRTEKGLAEALTLHSPAGIDLITHMLTGQAMDVRLARCVPAELCNAGLYTFDGTRIIADLCLLLPSEAQSGLVRTLAELKRSLGVDIEKDLLCNFGPTLALASSGYSLVSLDKELPRVFFACQLVDQARAQRTINSLIIAAGRSGETHDEVIEGARVTSLSIPLDGFKAPLELRWCIHDSVLLVGTHSDLVRDALRGLRGHDVVNGGLRTALAKAGEECFAAGFTHGEDGAPDAVTIGRRTTAGLEVTSADGVAMQATIFSLCALGIGSSLALPVLMDKRIEADEKAAGSTLTVMNDAELMARADHHVDADGDGLGEGLFLSELCGTSPVRGEGKLLSEPWLDNRFEWTEGGIGKCHGFYFRLDLPSEDGLGVSSAAGLADHPLATDAAEQRCLAYAWPIDTSTGHAVFAFDSDGGLYTSDNRGEQQHYVGTRGPAYGAHWNPDGEPGDGPRYVGRDGGTWTRMRAPGEPPGR